MTVKKLSNLIPAEMFASDRSPSAGRETALDIVKRLELAAAGRQHKASATQLSHKRLQIPIWGDEHRPVLHDLVRCALFTCGQRDARNALKGQKIYALEHIQVIYTGEELRQRDYDVYLQILHLSRGLTVDNREEWVQFDARKLVRALKWTQNTRSLIELRETIRRLTACALEVQRARTKTSPPLVYGGPLFLKYAGAGDANFDEVSQWRVQINSDFAAQLRPGDYTRINWEIRAQLAPLEKWLHAFYSTNRHPYPMKVETLLKLCGSRTVEVKSFRRALKKALERLAAVGFLSSWELDITDKVKVVRSQMITTQDPSDELS